MFEIARNEYGIEEHSALKVISIPQSDGEVQSLKNDGMTDNDTTEYFKGIVNDFVQEIQLMTQLKGNSNIVAYEDFAVVEKTESVGYEILIRMELLKGLPKYLRENQFRVYDVIQLGIDMCRALEVCRELLKRQWQDCLERAPTVIWHPKFIMEKNTVLRLIFILSELFYINY